MRTPDVSDKVDKYRNDQTVQEVRKQAAHQRDQQICLDGRCIPVAHSLHIGHGIGSSTHAEAAQTRNDDRRIVVPSHHVIRHHNDIHDHEQRLPCQQDDQRQRQLCQLPDLQGDHCHA